MSIEDIALLIFLFFLGNLLGVIIGIKIIDYIEYGRD